MKKMIFSLILTASATCFAKPWASVTVANDYNWRGISWTSIGNIVNNATLNTTSGAGQSSTPATSGYLGYQMDNGIGMGLWMSNHWTGPQFNQFVQYQLVHNEDLKNIFRVVNMTYPSKSDINAQDYHIVTEWTSLTFLLAYMPDYFGSKTSGTYVNLSYAVTVDEKLKFVPSVGYSSFGNNEWDTNPNAWGGTSFSNYMDYKAAFVYTNEGFSLEMAYTDTDRKTIVSKVETKVEKDEKFYVGLTKNF